MCTPWYVLDLCTKDEGDRAYGLGGVSEQTEDLTLLIIYIFFLHWDVILKFYIIIIYIKMAQ